MKILRGIVAYIWFSIVIILVMLFGDTEKEEYPDKEDDYGMSV